MNMCIWYWAVVLVGGLLGMAGLPRGAGVAEVEAAFPGRNGLIAFASNRAFLHELAVYTITPKGKQVTRLTENVGNNLDPAWSPDGKKIVFTSDQDGFAQLYVMKADGSKPNALEKRLPAGGITDYPNWQFCSGRR